MPHMCTLRKGSPFCFCGDRLVETMECEVVSSLIDILVDHISHEMRQMVDELLV